VIAGNADGSEPEGLIEELRLIARRSRLDLLAGVHGHRLVVVLGGTDEPLQAATHLAGRFGPGPIVVGPAVGDLQSAVTSAAAARAGPRAGVAGPVAPRPGAAADRLPGRALDGDVTARRELIDDIYLPLLSGGTALVDTVTTYLEQGSSLEATARMLFVHPNTVRYRLRRAGELTGLLPTDGRDGFALWLAVVFGRLERKGT